MTAETITCPCIRQGVHKPAGRSEKTGHVLCAWCLATVELFPEVDHDRYMRRVRELLETRG